MGAAEAWGSLPSSSRRTSIPTLSKAANALGEVADRLRTLDLCEVAADVDRLRKRVVQLRTGNRAIVRRRYYEAVSLSLSGPLRKRMDLVVRMSTVGRVLLARGYSTHSQTAMKIANTLDLPN